MNQTAQVRGLRWHPTEWVVIAAHAIPLIDRGANARTAIFKAQKTALEPHRQKSQTELERSYNPAVFGKFIQQARAMAPEDRDALKAPHFEGGKRKPKPAAIPAPAPAAAPSQAVSAQTPPSSPPPPKFEAARARYKLIERTYTGDLRWSKTQRALIARQVTHWRECGDSRPTSHLIIDAQELVLPPEFRRAHGGIKQAQHVKTRRQNDAWVKDALNDLWLIESVPFDHEAQAPSLGGGKLPGFVKEETAPPAAQEAPPAVETAQAAPTPAPQPTEAPGRPAFITQAMAAFVDTMTGALDKLLTAQAQHLLAAVHVSLAEHSRSTAANVAAMVEQGMRNAVHTMVEMELGGPVASTTTATNGAHAPTPEPDPPAPPVVAVPQAPAPRLPCLRVDVVGFEAGSARAQIRDEFDGKGVDIRFLNPDERSIKLHASRHVILVTGRVPHQWGERLKHAGIKPVQVYRTPGHVIQAIEELQRAQQAQAAH